MKILFFSRNQDEFIHEIYVQTLLTVLPFIVALYGNNSVIKVKRIVIHSASVQSIEKYLMPQVIFFLISSFMFSALWPWIEYNYFNVF